MRVTLGPLISEAQGSLGSCVFRSFNGSSYVQSRTHAKQHASQVASIRQVAITRAALAWTALTTDAKSAWYQLWSSWTQNGLHTRQLAPTPRLTFMKWALHWYSTGYTPPSSIPTYRDTGAVFYQSASFYQTQAFTISMQANEFGDAADCFLFCARCFATYPRPTRNWHFISYAIAPGLQPWSILSLFTPALGVPAVGEAINLRIVSITQECYLAQEWRDTIYVQSDI